MSSCLISCCTWYFNSEVPPGVGDVTLLRQEGAAGPGPAAATAAQQPGFHAQLLQTQALQELNNNFNNSKNKEKKLPILFMLSYHAHRIFSAVFLRLTKIELAHVAKDVSKSGFLTHLVVPCSYNQLFLIVT